MELPLFPLHAILFPGGILPLRIFEPRYLDMIGRCLRDNTGFGVCLIRSGRDSGETALIYDMGTEARSVDWERLENGMLGVTARGERKFRVISTRVEKDRLMVAEVAWLQLGPRAEVPASCSSLPELLKRVLAQLPQPYSRLEADFKDAGWVGSRLCELLPLDPAFKQRMLELEDPVARLEQLRGELKTGLLA